MHFVYVAQIRLYVEIRLENQPDCVIKKALSDISNGLRVTVDKLIHQPDVLTSPERPHCFAYYITIHNDGADQVTIRGRKWVVTEASGDVTAVEGDGVVGEFPTISSGEHFSYSSFHVIRSNRATAEGSYLGVNKKGTPVVLRIPPFELVVPESEIGYC